MEPHATPETIKPKSKHWLEKISAFNKHKMLINREKSALNEEMHLASLLNRSFGFAFVTTTDFIT